MKPEFDDSIISTIDLSVVDNRPLPPWIRKNSDGMIFTDEALYNKVRTIENIEQLKD